MGPLGDEHVVGSVDPPVPVRNRVSLRAEADAGKVPPHARDPLRRLPCAARRSKGRLEVRLDIASPLPEYERIPGAVDDDARPRGSAADVREALRRLPGAVERAVGGVDDTPL